MNTTNKEFSHDSVQFIEACGNARVKPTKRQASKYRMKKGRAYKEGRVAGIRTKPLR
jgi:hypothetical protein